MPYSTHARIVRLARAAACAALAAGCIRTRTDPTTGRVAVLRVTSLAPGASHPWRIHEGTCGSVGAQFGEAYAYAPLLVNDQGVAEGTAKLPALDIARKYKVRLFVSASDSTSEVVCGNLTYR